MSGPCGSRTRRWPAAAHRPVDDKLARLACHPLLRGLGTRALRTLGALADPVQLPAGTLLVARGHLPRHLYLLDGGLVLTEDGVHAADLVVPGLHACWAFVPQPSSVWAGGDLRGVVVADGCLGWLLDRAPHLLATPPC